MASIRSLMTANPITCGPDTSLREVAHMMIDHECGQIPVVDDAGRPLGMITDRDVAIHIVATRNDGDATAEDAMTASDRVLDADNELKDYVDLMEETQARHWPVVDASGKLAGIVSAADIALANRGEVSAEAVTGTTMLSA